MCSQPVDDTLKGFFKTRIGALPRYDISHWQNAIKAAVPKASFRSEQPLNCLLNGGAEGAKSTTEARRYVKVSRSQGQRERRRGLIECHFTLIGMGPYILFILFYWSMVCHEMLRPEDPSWWRSQHDLLGQVWLKHSNQPKKTSNAYYWNESKSASNFISEVFIFGSGSNSIIEKGF